MADHRVADGGVVMRRCGSCGQHTTLQVVEYRDATRWGPLRITDRHRPPYRLATCSARGARCPVRVGRGEGSASGAGWSYSTSR